MKMIKDNLASQELRISGDTIDILVDCCSGTFRIVVVFLWHSRIIENMHRHAEVVTLCRMPCPASVVCRVCEDVVHRSE